ncbi:MAG: tetratricopeptide repeat protein, partial [Planctomycetota bacterium]
RNIRFAVAVFLLALFVRGVYLYDSSDNPTFSAPIVDSLTYDLAARELAGGWGMSLEFFWQQFFYPFFLSVVYSVSNSSIVFAKIVQILLGSVTCVLTYQLGKRIFGRTVGVLAGVMAAVYGPLIFFDGELLSAGWASFWAAAIILLLLKTAEKKSLPLCLALGVCGALSVLTRPNFIPFLFAACVWLAFVWIRGRVGIKKLALGLVVLIGGFLAVTVPVAAKNYQVTGRFSFLPGTGGLNAYIGNNPDFEATALRPGLEWKKVVELPLRQGFKTPAERQSFFYARTFEYIREQPMDFVKGLGRKGLELVSSREMPGHLDVYMFRRWSPVLSVLVWKVKRFGFPFCVLLPLALLGLSLDWRKVPVPLLLFLVFYCASVILTHVETRYRMPVVVPLCILAGAGSVRIAELARAKRWLHLVAGGVLCAAVGFLCSVAGPFYSEEHVDYETELRYVLGGSLTQRGRIPEAIESYREAIKLKPDYRDAHQNLGLLLVEQKEPEEAVEHYNKALAIFPEDGGMHEGLGLALLEQGNIDDAVEKYEKALEIDPNRASAHDNLGRALVGLNRVPEAHRHLSRGLELNPDDAMTHNNMGGLLAISGQMEEAIKHFEMSLKLKPTNIEALNNLASALASIGRFDEAVETFNDALRIAPDDAVTYFNLGLCLQGQGQLDKAVEAYRKALAIQPGYKHAEQALKELLRSAPR